ncbi:hypothetical protein [Streptomyces sp. NPDC006638]|uniref:hypothetical protein n=1 Tax=Streptomyces sp. NPDC006638 TaxID=3157183 RepID=UPI0033A7976D
MRTFHRGRRPADEVSGHQQLSGEAVRIGLLAGRPVRDAARLRCPHLAIFGGPDKVFSTAARHPDRHPRATLTVEVFPGADRRVPLMTPPAAQAK